MYGLSEGGSTPGCVGWYPHTPGQYRTSRRQGVASYATSYQTPQSARVAGSEAYRGRKGAVCVVAAYTMSVPDIPDSSTTNVPNSLAVSLEEDSLGQYRASRSDGVGGYPPAKHESRQLLVAAYARSVPEIA
eukprot:2685361-Rhodomonas_salina.6